MSELKNLVGLYLKENGETGVVEVIEDHRLIDGVKTKILKFNIPNLTGFWVFKDVGEPQKYDVSNEVGYVTAVVCEDTEVDKYRAELRQIIAQQLQNTVDETYDVYSVAFERHRKFVNVEPIYVKHNVKFTVLTDEGEIEIVNEVELRHDQYFAQSTLAGCTLRGKMGDFKKLSYKLFFVISSSEAEHARVEEMLRQYAADQLRILAGQYEASASVSIGRAEAILGGTKK